MHGPTQVCWEVIGARADFPLEGDSAYSGTGLGPGYPKLCKVQNLVQERSAFRHCSLPEIKGWEESEELGYRPINQILQGHIGNRTEIPKSPSRTVTTQQASLPRHRKMFS